MSEQQIQVNGIELCTESFGDPLNPTVILIMGAQASMVWWEDEFCQRLADAGRYVIRYDNRDVGQSTTYEPGSPGYTFEDMADDTIAVMDAYNIDKAHIVGMSMGGLLTQISALRHPERLLSITLVSTSNFAPDLPPMEQKVIDFFSRSAEVDLTNEEEAARFAVEKWSILKGTKRKTNEAKIYNLAKREIRRSHNMASIHNHGLVTGGESYLTRTDEIAIPTLVIHGTEDPIIPYEHGKALARTIPGAALLTLDGAGHELHADDWPAIIEAITAHTSNRSS
ncbi:alpha/beta fold hydrolase [Paenibacillus tuaregi]|uniref:alpha/beta fold hydrolase n=1 Tax=Paenibacillus tuaregi TaxID=1816681 RepID=UPI000839659F|nr:alpha/beta hydrolase [Paenibacillus tuaregi]